MPWRHWLTPNKARPTFSEGTFEPIGANVCDEDRQANDDALRDGERLFSVYYTSKGIKIWVITEADRSSTCILLPEEY